MPTKAQRRTLRGRGLRARPRKLIKTSGKQRASDIVEKETLLAVQKNAEAEEETKPKAAKAGPRAKSMPGKASAVPPCLTLPRGPPLNWTWSSRSPSSGKVSKTAQDKNQGGKCRGGKLADVASSKGEDDQHKPAGLIKTLEASAVEAEKDFAHLDQ